jgi:trehalose/maltose hydrolase-like predicted phosphorylase
MDGGSFVFDGFDAAREGLREALCTLGNGYFATRGAKPESAADGTHYPGTYVAGCYDRLESEVAGRKVENEDLVNLPNWLPFTVRLADGTWLGDERVEILQERHELDLHRGTLTRRLRLRDTAGRTTLLTQLRLVSMADPHLAALQTRIVAEDWSGSIRIRTALEARVANCGVPRYRDLSGQHLRSVATGDDGEEIMWLQTETASSHIRVAEAARVRVPGAPRSVAVTVGHGAGYVVADFDIDLAMGAPIAVEKTAALYTSQDTAIAESLTAAQTAARRAPGFDELLAQHVTAWEQLWRTCRIIIGVKAPSAGQHGDDEPNDPQRVLDLYVFHLLQTLSPHIADLDVGVPARGLHGEAYRGHVFWDELFVFPFLVLRMPSVARALLLYRWRRLAQARVAASEAGFQGAMYPWQSGSDGREETQRLHLNPRSSRWLPDNSHLQRHVGIAVAYNIWRYYQATGDEEFLATHGTEMLVEIARFWVSAATYNKSLHRYEIRGVMGPDEYHERYPDAATPGIDNNAYTNVMAAWVVRRALDALDLLSQRRRRELSERVRLEPVELDGFADVASQLRVVFHGDKIISQFEGYERLQELDWQAYRAKYGDIRRLDRILEAEGDDVNRYQVSKQADVLMLFYLLGKDELTQVFDHLGYTVDAETILRSVEYYMARTSHGSTLSAVVHAWVLARTDRRSSWRFFLDALGSDVTAEAATTTSEGIHLGAMAGCIDLLQRCYTGLEIRDDTLRLNPRLPHELEELDLTLHYRSNADVVVQCRKDSLRVDLLPSRAAPILLAVKEQGVELHPGQTVHLALHRGHPDSRHPMAPPG